MKNVYIIDEHQSSKQNGIGTYIRQLLLCFRQMNVNIGLVSYNADVETFQIARKEYYTEYSIPICGMGGFLQNGRLTLSLLRLYINDSSENVFFVNHSPCSDFLRTIKKQFPMSRLYFVVHNQGWCDPLLGDYKLLQKIKNTSVRKKWQHIWNYIKDEKKMYRLADGVIALSDTTKEIIRSNYGIADRKIHLIPNGLHLPDVKTVEVSKEEMRRKLDIRPEEKVLLYAGRTVRSKGIFALLKAFNRVAAQHKNIRLVIAGQVRSLDEFTHLTCDCLSRVCYTGLLEKEELYKWYQAADITILPSYTEQSSYTGIEILAFGKLSIVANGLSMKDMFTENEVLMIEPGKDRERDEGFADQLASAIEHALAMDEASRMLLETNSRRLYERKYALEHKAEKYSALLER